MLLAAVMADLHTGKVPNELIVLGVLAGAMFGPQGTGIDGVITFVWNLLFPILILFPVYLLRGLGAGDVKLFAALSSIIGAELIPSVIIYSFLIGAILGIARWILTRQLHTRMVGMVRRVYAVRSMGQFFAQSSEELQRSTLHFTVCIVAAYLWCIGKEGIM